MTDRRELSRRTAFASHRHLGAESTERFIDLVAAVGDRLIDRIDQTVGTKWMPAGRHPGIET